MSKPQRMVLQFPPDAPQILSVITIYDEHGVEQHIHISDKSRVVIALQSPDADFKYTIDNANKTLTTESDKPFLL